MKFINAVIDLHGLHVTSIVFVKCNFINRISAKWNRIYLLTDVYGHPVCYILFFFNKVLITKPDFFHEESRKNLIGTLKELLQLSIVPILNTNDAVAPPPQIDKDLQGVNN